jgi:DNA-binding MarR family transcriptional regulator
MTIARRTPASPARKAAPAKAPKSAGPVNWRREDSMGYLMGRIMAIVKEAVDHELTPQDLTHAQWVPLFKLYMGEASTVAELARETHVDVGAMTRTLDRLEAKGLVRRVRSVEDRRVVNLELTEDGRATAKQIPAVLCHVQDQHLRGFDEEEWHLLKGMLTRILETAVQLQQEREGKQTP